MMGSMVLDGSQQGDELYAVSFDTQTDSHGSQPSIDFRGTHAYVDA